MAVVDKETNKKGGRVWKFRERKYLTYFPSNIIGKSPAKSTGCLFDRL